MNGVNVSASGGTLQKTGGCGGCADAGAASDQQIGAGDGGMQFTASDASTLKFVGLTAGAASHNPSEMQFALRIQNGVAEVRESGAYRSEIRFTSGDVLAIYVVGGGIHYAKNGTIFYSSAKAAAFPLRVDASLYDANATISQAMVVRSTAQGASVASTPAPSASGPQAQRIAVPKRRKD